MRKLTKKIFALLGSFALAAAMVSCGDIATGDETQNLSETQGKARVIVNIESGLRSATLLPSDLPEADITRVILRAKKVEDDPKRIVDPSDGFDVYRVWTSSESQTAISQMKADMDILVDIATYDFELLLYKSYGEGDYILCESAKLTQTMHLGNNTLNFAAKYVSDENATGSLEVKFKFEKEDYVEYIGVEFYKAGDEPPAQNENVYIYNKTNENDTFTAEYSMSGLKEGDYILKFYVYGLYPEARMADTSLINTYQKLVRIAPFCKTFAEIELDNLNSIYITNFVLPDGVESDMGDSQRSRNKSCILPGEDNLLVFWPFHKFIGWYANEKFEGEPVYYIEQGTKGDKTFYAKFEEDSLLVIDDISTLDTLGEQLAAANKAGLKSVTVKITDKIPLDPLGENWMEDAVVDNKSSGETEYKYASKAFAQITSVLEDFMNSSSTSDSEEYNGMKIELDLTETGISYLPTCAFRFRSLKGESQDWTDAALGCLTAVKLPDTVTAILPRAVQLTGITSFEVPANVTGIGEGAFDGCNSLEVVNFAEGSKCTSIGKWAFYDCSNLKSITIPADVLEIGVEAFKECVGLGTVNFAKESKCTSIGDGAFFGCENLKSIAIPAGVTEIGNWAFEECVGLGTVNFAKESKCTSIGDGAFGGCSNLKSITIPAGVTEIGNYAFDECENLTEINFAGTKEKWANVEKGSNIFPATVKEIKCTDEESIYTYVEYD